MLASDQPTTTTTTTGDSIQGTTNNEAPILVGYLWKKSQSASRADETANNIWYRRWFVLKRDHCLYYYKNQDVSTFFSTAQSPVIQLVVCLFYLCCCQGLSKFPWQFLQQLD
jgi:hypothetical protein